MRYSPRIQASMTFHTSVLMLLLSACSGQEANVAGDGGRAGGGGTDTGNQAGGDAAGAGGAQEGGDDLGGGFPAEVCGNGSDDDGDGDVDEDCGSDSPEIECDDGVDNDADGSVDCADSDCPCTEICGDGVDNDLDGAKDCADSDCSCTEDCSDGVDNDADGAIDCADSDCPCTEVCGDSLDNDKDGKTDCDDSDCPCGEVCSDGTDNDGDGAIDCADPNCPCYEFCDPFETTDPYWQLYVGNASPWGTWSSETVNPPIHFCSENGRSARITTTSNVNAVYLESVLTVAPINERHAELSFMAPDYSKWNHLAVFPASEHGLGRIGTAIWRDKLWVQYNPTNDVGCLGTNLHGGENIPGGGLQANRWYRVSVQTNRVGNTLEVSVQLFDLEVPGYYPNGSYLIGTSVAFPSECFPTWYDGDIGRLSFGVLGDAPDVVTYIDDFRGRPGP